MAGSRLHLVSDRGALLGSHRLGGIELPTALLDTASPLVPGNGGTDMVRASSLACSSDFQLCPADRQGKDLVAETGRAMPPTSSPCARSARASGDSRLGSRGRCFGRGLKFFQVMRLQRKRCPTLHIAALPAGAQDASRLLNEVHIPFAIDRDEVSCTLVTGPCLVDHFCGHIGKTPRG